MSNKKAFTLIELLIMVAIIGILAGAILVSVITARNHAKDNSFKTTTKSIQTGLVSCCINQPLTRALPNNAANRRMCNGSDPSLIYPDLDSVGLKTGGNTCSDFYSNGKTIEPGTKNKGNCTNAIITQDSITYTDC
ncbi:MAG TPA: type II secretion system protein [Candidatus Moranbacteria bacterium]|nr:type II secretion system protein [Candidatus Moranbacteria bacterium]